MPNNLLYTLVEMHRMGMVPYRVLAQINKKLHLHPSNPMAFSKAGRSFAAGYELFERITRHYNKPEFGITQTVMDSKPVRVYQRSVVNKPFCKLLHFRKDNDAKQEKMLIVAPMSGHYATLLRGTVEGLLPYYDVYITDWMNGRDVPVTEGRFGLDDFIEYCIGFLEHLGKGTNVLAVCQPSVPVLAAVSLMSAENNPYVPKSLILMGGPVDTRKSPTEVNNFAMEREISWFENNVITSVPANYPGFMRKVYPGFIQLSGFMAMNMYKHIGEHLKLFYHLIEGDGESADAHKAFYNEYLSVMDLPAEFYLETVNAVFHDYSLPRGKLLCRGKKVDPAAITSTALLAIEGEKDDISGRGQTKAALTLCKNIPENKKEYILQKNVGHYGLFNGRRYREEVVPNMRAFIDRVGEKPKTAKKKPAGKKKRA